MGEKVFKTTDELIQMLISRGMDISTTAQKSYAKKTLQHYGYYNLINGYNKLFIVTKTPEDRFKQGTTMEEIVGLYDFDCKLRNCILMAILPFETNVKSLIAYHFPKVYGHDNYLKYKNFDVAQRDSHRKIADVISEFQKQISARASDPAIMHYLKNYGYIPLWVMNSILSFGQISKFYSIMKQQDRMNVSKTFRVMDDQFQSILYYLSSIRNFCAHGNRLYCYRSQKPLIDLNEHVRQGIKKSNGEYEYGKRDLYACLIALKCVMPKSDFKKLLKEIETLLKELKTRLAVIELDDVLKEMGFPSNWKKMLSSYV